MECQKQGVVVVSYGADGHSRELKAMQLSTQLSLSGRLQGTNHEAMNLQKLHIPLTWYSWLALKNPTRVAVQDVVPTCWLYLYSVTAQG